MPIESVAMYSSLRRHLTAMRAIAVVVALEAIRGRMLWLMVVFIGAGFAISQFTAQIAITESEQIAHGILAFCLRTASVFVVALFVFSSMLRDWSCFCSFTSLLQIKCNIYLSIFR